MLSDLSYSATNELTNWHTVWQKSLESAALREIDRIHAKGRQRGAVEESLHSEYATPWLNQLTQLLKRDAAAHYRSSDYLMAKLVLNIVGGLFIGFTFYNSKDSQQGTQNKLFAIFMGTILIVALANQLQAPFINMRNIYKICERPSHMYTWTALIASQIIIEIPWNILGSSLFYFTWYWTVDFDSSRAGYTYLTFAIVFPLYYTTIGQAIAAMSPNTEIAVFHLVNLAGINGYIEFPTYTYLVEGLLGNTIGRQDINCSPVEFVTVQPPSGQTCEQYMGPYISNVGGYLSNPNALINYGLCAFRTTDECMSVSFHIFYNHRWRNIGFMPAFVLFNIFATFALTYLFHMRTGRLLTLPKTKGSK